MTPQVDLGRKHLNLMRLAYAPRPLARCDSQAGHGQIQNMVELGSTLPFIRSSPKDQSSGVARQVIDYGVKRWTIGDVLCARVSQLELDTQFEWACRHYSVEHRKTRQFGCLRKTCDYDLSPDPSSCEQVNSTHLYLVSDLRMGNKHDSIAR